jgi:predicted transcriptional regulator
MLVGVSYPTMESTKESYDIIYKTLKNDISDWKTIMMSLKENPYISQPYGDANVARLLQDIAIMDDIMNSSDQECLILRNNPSYIHQRDLNYDTTDKKLRQQYIDFTVGAWKIEYKCPFFATDAKIEKMKKSWHLKHNPDSSYFIRVRIINLDYDWINNLINRVPELTKVTTQMKQLLTDLTLKKRITTRSHDYSNVLWEDDINHGLINQILKKYYNKDYNDINEVVKEFENYLGFEQFEFEQNKETFDKEWENLLQSYLKQVQTGLKFFENNVLLTEDILKNINYEDRWNANSFSRDTNPSFKKRLKLVMNVLPKRDFIKLESMSDKTVLSNLFRIINKKYFDGIYSKVTKIIENFEDYSLLRIMSNLYYEKKSEEKTIIADSEIQKVRMVDIIERRKKLLEDFDFDYSSDIEYKNKLIELRNKFEAKKTLHCGIKFFVKEQEKDRNSINPKPIAEIKDYEKYMENLIEEHEANKLDDLEHPLLNINGDEEIYGNKDLNELIIKILQHSSKEINNLRKTNTWQILSEQDDILSHIMINMLKSVKQASIIEQLKQSFLYLIIGVKHQQ